MGQFGNLRAVLWDMDGVLVDSRHAHFIALQEILGQHGFELTEEAFKPTFGMTTEQGIRQISGGRFSDEVLDEICAQKNAQYRRVIAKEAKIIDGVEEWLAHFKRAGVLQALASSSPWADINIILEALRARPYFDAVVSGEDCAGKPDPAVFLRAATQLEVDPSGCLVIEDSIVGIQAAASAGMKCLAIATTFPLDKLPKTGLNLQDLTGLTEEMLAGLFPA
jgi:HAD superfamily hydrolase (TIGR01509 family)